MATQAVESHRENAEVIYGNDLCKAKIQEKLKELELPNGLLPLEEVTEFGMNPTTGYVWVKQKNTSKHRFTSIDKTVSYGQEITAFVEKRRLKKVTGVKVRELLIWISLGDFCIEDKDPAKLVIKTAMYGIPVSYPVSAFLLEDGEKK
ncbi:hypothetical protein ACHQM5_013479 [Ranunculus cassubicifolius]